MKETNNIKSRQKIKNNKSTYCSVKMRNGNAKQKKNQAIDQVRNFRWGPELHKSNFPTAMQRRMKIYFREGWTIILVAEIQTVPN